MEKRALLLLAVAISVIVALVAYHQMSVQPYGGQPRHKSTTFAVYYGPVNSSIIQVLNQFSLIVLDPSQVNSSQLKEIKAVKVAYIDLGELTNVSISNVTPPPVVAIGYDSQWSQYIVNVSSPAWQEYIKSLVSAVMAMGFQGVLFDDVDIVELYPSTAPGVVEIINWTRVHYPHAVIGINRGFAILGNVSRLIDFVLFEDYGTKVTSPGKVGFSDPSFVVNMTHMLKAHNVTVLALGYAYHPGDAYWDTVVSLAKSQGVPYFVSNWNLSVIWQENLRQ